MLQENVVRSRGKYLICCILLCCVFCACTDKNENLSEGEIVVISGFQNVTIDPSLVIKDVEVLKISTDTTFIGIPKDICIIDSVIYILDDINNIYAYDWITARLIKSVHNVGSGPNEYVDPIALSADGKNLYLLDFRCSTSHQV